MYSKYNILIGGEKQKIIGNTRHGYFKNFRIFPTFARKKFGIVDPRTYGQILPILDQKRGRKGGEKGKKGTKKRASEMHIFSQSYLRDF